MDAYYPNTVQLTAKIVSGQLPGYVFLRIHLQAFFIHCLYLLDLRFITLSPLP
jgi:hypothetical protein